jgi:hypothetical protein
MMIESGEGDFAAPAESVDVVANQSSYDLTTVLTYNPVMIRMVERFQNNIYKTLEKSEFIDGNIYAPGIGESDFYPSYRFSGTRIVFNQIPAFSQTAGLRIEGYKLPNEMVIDADQPAANFHPIYHNLLVLWATVGAMESKEFTGTKDDSTMFRIRLEKMENQFISVMNNRSEFPERVTPFQLDGDF